MRISDWSSDVCSSDLNDEYFIEKKLYPNVDFYSGVIPSAIGFPTDMFTVFFALARTVGWVAQWNEMISDPAQRIGRPRLLYTGPQQRDDRSEEHTSELQSLMLISYAVFGLKKK